MRGRHDIPTGDASAAGLPERPGDGDAEEVAVARLDGIGGTDSRAPVARLDTDAAERPAPDLADLAALTAPDAPAPSRVAALGSRADGPDGGAEGGPDGGGGFAEDHARPAAPDTEPAVALFPIEGLDSSREDVRVARLGGPVRGRAGRRAEESTDPDAPRRRGAGRERRRPAVVEAIATGRSRAEAGPDSPSDEDGDPIGAKPGRRRGRSSPAELDPDADPVAVAREICLKLLTDRARTRQELAQALHRRGVPAEAAATVLERFDEVGLIDDAAFAGQWARSRHTHRGLARRAIAVELRRKGVSDEDADEALAGIDDESEERRARELVDRKLRSLTVTTPERRAAAARRLVGMLARKGYGAGVAYRVVKEALAEHGADADELGDAEPPDG